MTSFQLSGKDLLWWQDVKIYKNIKEKEMFWKKFKELFKHQHLTKRFYDEKTKEFHELKLE